MMERTLHRDFYFSDEIFQQEKERIFFREWICAGREEQLPRAGDYLVLDVLGESVLVVRTREGTLAAHYNVCRHRGSRLTKVVGLTVLLVAGGALVYVLGARRRI